jgi:formate hydrogenlyase transcriptional activator
MKTNLLDSNNILANQSEEKVLRAIVEGTATAIGTEFFRALVKYLALALGVNFAFVAEFAEVNTRVKTIAYWGPTDFRNNVEFSLDGTPCKDVLQGKLCHYPAHVKDLFPKDVGLVKLEAEGYLGVPLVNANGQILGHLVVFDTRPMPEEPKFLSIFHIFASRAAAELERKRIEQALQESEQRLANILASAMDAIIALDDNFSITLFNKAAEKTFCVSAKDIIGQSFQQFLTPKLINILNEYISNILSSQNKILSLWLPENLLARRANGEEFPIEATISQVTVLGKNLYTIILRDINERKIVEDKLQTLELDNLYLQEEIRNNYNFEEIIGSSAVMKAVFQKIKQVASTDSTVLIIGETGTGKELIAHAIHNHSKRKNRPLIKVNCAALSAGLIESEFFGHEKGAFTGAISQKIGRFELANGGTIFLDEIGEISLEIQAKLLRVLQEQEFERVGGVKTLKVDVRVIAATNRNLKQMVSENSFRADLYYRLNVFPINLPALRERSADIPLLVGYFVNKHMSSVGKKITSISQKTMQKLIDYTWPGNIRELENIVERALILSEGNVLEIEEDFLLISKSPSLRLNIDIDKSLEDTEKEHIIKILTKTAWVIEGAQGAATILKINPNTLRSRMKKLGITRPC